MAVRQRTSTRSAKRVVLSRTGSNNGQENRNTRRTAVKKREYTLPWAGINKFFSTIAFFLGALLTFVTVSFFFIYGYRYATSTQYFALKTIEIQGNSRLNSKEILDITSLSEGANTLAVSIDDMEKSLKASPWIQEASVKRVLPDTFIIGLQERVPAFWVHHEEALYYADAKGSLIAPVVSGKFASLPILEVEPGAEEATKALPDLVRSLRESNLPLNMGAVSWVRLSPARGVEVYMENSQLKISIGLEEWMANLHRLERTLVDLGKRGELPEIREIRAQGSNVWVEKATAVITNG